MPVYKQPNYSWDSFLNNTEKNINLQELNVIGKRKVKPLLPNSPLASNISKESSIYKIPSYTDLTGLEGVSDNSKFQMYHKFNTGEVTPLAKPTDAYLKAPKPTTIPIKSDGIKTPPPPIDGQGLSTISAANIATGISTAANVASSIYGAIQASKMKPYLSKFQTKIDPVLLSDNTNAIETSGQESIQKSIATTRANNQRNGLVGMDGVIMGKENEGLNQLSAQLTQYRNSINGQNAQIENSMKQFNAQTAQNNEQFNAQTNNQFRMQQSALIGQGMKNATDSLSAGVGSIFKNLSQSSQIQLMSVESEIESLLNEPNGSVLNAPRIETLQKESKAIRESIYGNKIYNT